MMARLARWLLPSLGSLLGLAALANGLFLRGPGLFAADGDVGRHIRVGRTILARGEIPRVDLFSHTRRGSAFVPYEWLSESATALVDAAGGLAGVAVLSVLLYAIAILALYRTAEELGANRLLAVPPALLALLLQSVHLLPRPHLFTTAFAAIFMVLLVRFARTASPWALAPLPVLMLIWANSHGGFLMGFVLLAAFTIGALVRSPEFLDGRRAVRPLLLAAGACVLASLANPAGPELWTHTTGYLGIDFLVDATHEYRSVDFHEFYGKLFFVALFAGPALWMTGRVRVSPLAAGLFLLFAAASLHSVRNIPLFTVAALPWLAVWAEDALEQGGPRARSAVRRMRSFTATDRSLVPLLPALTGGALLWIALGPAARTYRFDDEVFPVRALQALDEIGPTGPVFNQLRWGGYLLYARPEIPVFIDGQTDFYGPELSAEYLAVVGGRPGWEEILDRYGVAWVFTYQDEPITELLALAPAWSRVYADSTASIFSRSVSGSDPR